MMKMQPKCVITQEMNAYDRFAYIIYENIMNFQRQGVTEEF